MGLPPAYEILRKHRIRFIMNASEWTDACPECGGKNLHVQVESDGAAARWRCGDCGWNGCEPPRAQTDGRGAPGDDDDERRKLEEARRALGVEEEQEGAPEIQADNISLKTEPAPEPKAPTIEEATALRRALVAAGYLPIPLYGKIPPNKDNNKRRGFTGWSDITSVTNEMIVMWARTWPDAVNTGVLTRNVPTLDLDILNEEAVRACEDLVRERSEEAGYILVRIGLPPKRAIPFRTEEPFDKIVVNVIAPNGSEGQKIEFLGNGQQVVVAGIHPDTKRPYRWHGGEPGAVKREDLPSTREAEARALVDDLGELLVRDFGYRVGGIGKKPGPGGGPGHVDMDELVRQFISGASLHPAALAMIGSWAHAGIRKEAVLSFLDAIFVAAKQVRYSGRWPELETMVEDIYAKEQTKTSGRAVGYDDFWYCSPENKHIFTPTGALWTPATVNLRLPMQGGIKPATWIAVNRAVEQMTWAPGKPQLIKDELIVNGGWIPRPQAQVFNLYRPPRPNLGRRDHAGPWINHLYTIFPAEARHIELWLACRAQRPHVKINHSLVLGGAQGIGKDAMLEGPRHAVGDWNCQTVSPIQLLGRFNGFLKSVLLVVSEARDLGEVNRPNFYEHTKAIIAAPPNVLYIDEKNTHPYYIPNLCGVTAPPHRGIAREAVTVVIDGRPEVLEVVRQPRINGGQQAYWSCPCCGVLRSHLYVVDGVLACRVCHRLDYRSRHVLHPAVLRVASVVKIYQSFQWPMAIPSLLLMLASHSSSTDG